MHLKKKSVKDANVTQGEVRQHTVRDTVAAQGHVWDHVCNTMIHLCSGILNSCQDRCRKGQRDVVKEETQNTFFVPSKRKKIQLRYDFPGDILESKTERERSRIWGNAGKRTLDQKLPSVSSG